MEDVGRCRTMGSFLLPGSRLETAFHLTNAGLSDLEERQASADPAQPILVMPPTGSFARPLRKGALHDVQQPARQAWAARRIYYRAAAQRQGSRKFPRAGFHQSVASLSLLGLTASDPRGLKPSSKAASLGQDI